MTGSLLDAALSAIEGFAPPRFTNSARAQAIMHNRYKRSLGLPTRPDALTLFQRQTLIEHCQRDLDGPQPAGAFEILAGLLLGRRPDAIQTVSIDDDLALERWILEPMPAVAIKGIPMRSTRPDTRGRFTLEEPGEHVIPLPGVLADHLSGYLSFRQAGATGNIPEQMTRLNEKLNWNATDIGIANALYGAILACGHDNALASLIVGQTPLKQPALHYLTVDPVLLQAAYRDGLEWLSGGRITIGASSLGIGAGSTMTPRPRSTKEIYRDLPAYIKGWSRRSLPQLCHFHNRYTALVITTLAFCTGHRPVNAPYDTLKTIDLSGKLGAVCWIDDKRTHLSADGRLVPLSPTAAAQIKHWLTHVAALQRHVAKHGGTMPGWSTASHVSPINLAEEVRSGSYDLFFFLKAGADNAVAVLGATRSLVTKHLGSVGFTPTAPRHALRQGLLESRLPSDVVNAIMGHAGAGGEPFAVHSGLSVADIVSAREALETIVRHMGIVPLKGLK